ncbi:MAG TPA: HAD-IC family P-type ATPase, partial [Propionibacteriaceae bacterium]|nr:HAD-IC family P-type ATPase [Propionibacteriaceae bacterium]
MSDALAGEGLAALEPDRVVDALGSSGEGLSATEVAARLQQFGRNEIAAQRSRSQTLELLAQFASPMAILMWVAGGIAVLAGLLELGLAVFAVVVINGVFGYWQEYRAERATEALRRMLAQRALVLRDGAETEVPTEELVPGDLLLLTEGERIGADARLIECSDLRVDQSTLTGESRSVHKSPAAIHGRRQAPLLANMVFAGTSVVSGDGRGVVTSTGMDTEFGRIAHLTQSVPDVASPLQQELGRLTRELSVLALAMGALYFVVAVLFVGQPGVTAFVFALAMIVAFIPEGLLPTVTLSLAMAVQRMAQRNALVKKLSSVETLGCTT